MTIPVWVLLGFAAWTVLLLVGTVGAYRWRRILAGRASVREWRADLDQGDERYRRAMRAHANCVENLPVYTAIVVAMVATGVQGPALDALAVLLLAARIIHSLVHVVPEQTEAVATLRFAFFFVQFLCLLAMGVIVAVRA